MAATCRSLAVTKRMFAPTKHNQISLTCGRAHVGGMPALRRRHSTINSNTHEQNSAVLGIFVKCHSCAEKVQKAKRLNQLNSGTSGERALRCLAWVFRTPFSETKLHGPQPVRVRAELQAQLDATQDKPLIKRIYEIKSKANEISKPDPAPDMKKLTDEMWGGTCCSSVHQP